MDEFHIVEYRGTFSEILQRMRLQFKPGDSIRVTIRWEKHTGPTMFLPADKQEQAHKIIETNRRLGKNDTAIAVQISSKFKISLETVSQLMKAYDSMQEKMT